MAHHSGTANRNGRRAIAEDTLAAIERGSYLTHSIANKVAFTNQNTKFYPPDSELSQWSTGAPPPSNPTDISLLEISTLVGARRLLEILSSASPRPLVGVLNFASAKNPGGGFLGGSRAQEESIARSSALYPSLTTPIAQSYYTSHRKDPKGGYYSHAMIYSPGVVIIRDDEGGWVEPLEVDILTSPAVNAGVVRKSTKVTADAIESTMRERMARILYLFEKQGIRNIVLGSFGTGAFRNDVGMVVNIWADLLLDEKARFGKSFDRVLFAVLGKETFEKFEEVFAQRDKADVT